MIPRRAVSPVKGRQPQFIIVMGVSGSGKTTVGRVLAERLNCPFYDADDYHSPANRDKMAAGTPLTDGDRAAWLRVLAEVIGDGLARGESGVLACSALKARYRAALQLDPARVSFVYLKGDYAAIQARMEQREGHYMKAPMLQSQFETLEEPAGALTVDANLAPRAIVEQVVAWLETRQSLTTGAEPKEKA